MSAALAHVRLSETLRVARLRRASDLHLCAGLPPVLRVDGALQIQSSVPLSHDELEAIASAWLDDAAVARLDRDGDVTVSHCGAETGSARLHAIRTDEGTSFAIRLFDDGIPSIESLQLPPSVSALANRERGLVIFAGPTGSGKSTGLAALVDRINGMHAKHIIIVEDPIEYRHSPKTSIVTQREIGRDVRCYADAVYGALRSDPDVILIGEMRDPATMRAALTAAETGHLVLTTVHTGNSAQTIDRILGASAGDERDHIRIQLAQTLAAVISIRLLPRADGQGRRSAVEVLIANDAVRSLIRDGKTHQLRNVVSTGRRYGMQTLEMHLCDLVASGEVSLESARTAADYPEDLHPGKRIPE